METCPDKQTRDKVILHEQILTDHNRRLELLEADHNTLNDLALSIKELAIGLKNTNQTVLDIKDDVIALKEEPADKYRLIRNTIITAVVSAVIGFLISYFLK